MKRVILRVTDEVEKELLSWKAAGEPSVPSAGLFRVLLMSLSEPVEFMDDEMDLDSPAPRRVKIHNAIYVEERLGPS